MVLQPYIVSVQSILEGFYLKVTLSTIVNETCNHNPKATIIGLTGQGISRPQLKVLIKKLWKPSFILDF